MRERGKGFSMKRVGLTMVAVVSVFYVALTLLAAYLLPDLLLNAWTPVRTDADRVAFQNKYASPGSTWTRHTIVGGEKAEVDLYWLHRPDSRGVAIHLHGAFDDAWGSSSPRFAEMPEWDAVLFTFRGRDRHPEVPCTLGAWERYDLLAAVKFLETQGVDRGRIVLVGNSMGAGIALQALPLIERDGTPLGGALLESPFRDLWDAANNHVRGVLGWGGFLAQPAVALGLRIAGHRARFDPETVSPVIAAATVKTPVALITGDDDHITPLEGIRAIARFHPDLTVISGACHMCAGGRFPGGWKAWADARLAKWGL